MSKRLHVPTEAEVQATAKRLALQVWPAKECSQAIIDSFKDQARTILTFEIEEKE